jgi:putative DNA primase/helicase
MPDWLLERLTRAPDRPRFPMSDHADAAHSERWAEAAFTGELSRLRTAQEGMRNDTLNRIAFRLGQIVAAGALDENRVRASLLQGAQAIGLGEREAMSTMESGLRAGESQPRGPRSADGYELDATA